MNTEWQFSVLQTILIWGIPLLFAITLHEVAHGWMAWRLGDPTAKMLGRISLNPIRHIDPVGTILLPALTVWLGGIIFGWAKPVPITWRNLKHPRRDRALVALAGPLANLLMAFCWGAFAWGGHWLAAQDIMAGAGFDAMGKVGIQVNCILLLLNLLPLPPLDGGRIVSSLLPGRAAYYYDKIEPYGLLVLLLLLAFNILPLILGTPLVYLMNGLAELFQL